MSIKQQRRFRARCLLTHLKQRPLTLLILLSVWASADVIRADDGRIGSHVQIRMLALVLVCADQPTSTAQQQDAWMKHLKWTQRYFAERLDGDTFELAADKPDVIRLQRPLAFYRSLKKGEPALQWTAELLEHLNVSRFDCPYTLCCLVMNPQDRWPVGGGRSLNGGVNRGGGMLVISSFALDKLPNFQSTLRHEIAHTVGLPHVDSYGYDMKTTRSLMAYNKMHQTNRFQESRTPARLIPEDVRMLALADNVFPKTRFDVKQDVPTRYKLFPRVVTLGPMKIPGHPDYGPAFSAPSGEDNGSKAAHLNQRFILPSIGPGVTFDNKNMWAWKKQPDGKVVLDIVFPQAVTLTKMFVHSEHSGQYNRADQVLVETVDGANSQKVADAPLMSADADLEFPNATAAHWRLTFQAGKSGKVCLRGLQFFNGEQALFPPPVPYHWEDAAAR